MIQEQDNHEIVENKEEQESAEKIELLEQEASEKAIVDAGFDQEEE